jgi:hypothetical protein
MVERYQVAKAVILKTRNHVEKAMSRIEASRWLSFAGLLLRSAFIVALLFN